MSSTFLCSATILAAGCAGLLISAAYATVVEMGPFANQTLSERATIKSMSTNLLAPGLSIQSQIDFLFHCRVAMTSVAGRAQPSPVRRTFLDTCGTASQVMVAASPGFSAAWYTGALVASFTSDTDRMNQWLNQSYSTGPFEQWIAELRVDLAEDNFDRLKPGLAERHITDLAMLLSNDRGRRFLAPRYLAFAPMRQRLDQLLSQSDEASTRRFRNMVERLRIEKGRTHGR